MSIKIKAAVAEAKGEPFQIQELDLDEPRADEVLVRIVACGQCEPCLQAHYPYCDHAAEVNFSGARLDGTIGVHRQAGSPASAVRGHFFGQSSFATHALATERNTVKVPEDLPLELLGPLGCGLQTGASTVLNAFRMTAGQTLAVFGVGAERQGCR